MANVLFLVYDNSTGEILRSGKVDTSEIADQADTGQTAMDVPSLPGDDAAFYVDTATEAVIARPTLTAPSLSTAPATVDMAGFPTGTAVQAWNADGETVQTSNPADPVTLTEPGTYLLSITPPFPHVAIDMSVTLA